MIIELIDFKIITDTLVCFIAPYLYICIFFKSILLLFIVKVFNTMKKIC